jgi:hypothetical protein
MSKIAKNHLETLGVVQKRRMMTPLARNPVTPTRCQQQSYLICVVPAVRHNLFFFYRKHVQTLPLETEHYSRNQQQKDSA